MSNLHFNFLEKQSTYNIWTSNSSKTEKKLIWKFQLLHFKLYGFKVTITDHMWCVLSAIYLKDFISPVDRKVSTSDWKCQRSCNEKLMKRKDYWHKLRRPRWAPNSTHQEWNIIINNFLSEHSNTPRTGWLLTDYWSLVQHALGGILLLVAVMATSTGVGE